MLEEKLTYSNAHLTLSNFQAIVATLAQSGDWRPAIFESRKTLAEIVGFTPSRMPSELRTRRRPDSTNNGDVEVFFVDNTLYFLINEMGDAIGSEYAYEIMWFFESQLEMSDSFLRKTGLLAGGIGPSGHNLTKNLQKLCLDFAMVAQSLIEEQDGCSITIEWEQVDNKNAVAKRVSAQIEEAGEPGVRFTHPTLDEVIMSRANVLADRAARDLLKEINKAGFARKTDILARRGKKHDEYESALNSLKEADLIMSEYLLQCRATSAQLTRVTSEKAITEASDSGFRCPSCSRSFSDELLIEGYSVSEHGKELLQGSHWMTVWVTIRLLNIGVPVEVILWNAEESGEEVDIILDFVGRTWIFELKDRQFGAGDAYPFNYRKVRYGADEAVVITTETIGSDAQRVFKDLSLDRSGRREKSPVLIEGLSNVDRELEMRFSNSALANAHRVLAIPSVVSGYDFRNIFDTDASGGEQVI